MNSITIIGIVVIIFYGITQILKFYGLGEEVYGIYLLFWIMLITCIFVLPNNYPSV
jgi:hypothetical protein